MAFAGPRRSPPRPRPAGPEGALVDQQGGGLGARVVLRLKLALEGDDADLAARVEGEVVEELVVVIDAIAGGRERPGVDRERLRASPIDRRGRRHQDEIECHGRGEQRSPARPPAPASAPARRSPPPAARSTPHAARQNGRSAERLGRVAQDRRACPRPSPQPRPGGRTGRARPGCPAAAPRAVSRRALASQAPIRTASGGNTGRIYGISFDCDLEKNRKTTAAQTARNHESAFSLRRAHPPARASRRACQRNPTHGNSPTSTTGTKYHHGPVRPCAVVVNRSQCSWMK